MVPILPILGDLTASTDQGSEPFRTREIRSLLSAACLLTLALDSGLIRRSEIVMWCNTGSREMQLS